MFKKALAVARPFGARGYAAAGSEKIAMVGSGNFGSALVRILGRNAARHDVFDNEVRMYVHEEMIDGKPLTQIINETNENVKYLKGAKFTPNVVADPNLDVWYGDVAQGGRHPAGQALRILRGAEAQETCPPPAQRNGLGATLPAP